ncbi:MAG: hypothetical protein LQ342_002561 [Letrouitia transgressa]|nr:MAG: hypothetical protein LQ342_002561 [Letrouitia transgressa]
MDSQIASPPPPHGQKRPADDDLASEQRLAKRFNLLNLEHNGKLYLPVKPSAPPGQVSAPNAEGDSMQLDDTKEKVYIHNLDAELAEVSSDEEKLVFLPDIEKKFAKIPRSVLTSQNPPRTNNQVVLYNVPSSLSVPQEQDNVRRAIIDSRARTREKQAQELKMAQATDSGRPDTVSGLHNHESIPGSEGMEIDENIMDID